MKTKENEGINRFIIFCGENYYANGGARDFYKTAQTIEEARTIAKEALGMVQVTDSAEWSDTPELDCICNKIEWSQVFDLVFDVIVHEEGSPYGCKVEKYRKAREGDI